MNRLLAFAAAFGLSLASAQALQGNVEISPDGNWDPNATFDPQTQAPNYGSEQGGSVDPATGRAGGSAQLISIGDPQAGGLAYIRDFSEPEGRRDNFFGAVEIDGDDIVVHALGRSFSFERSGSTFTPQHRNGADLVETGAEWRLTDRLGNEFVFAKS